MFYEKVPNCICGIDSQVGDNACIVGFIVFADSEGQQTGFSKMPTKGGKKGILKYVHVVLNVCAHRMANQSQPHHKAIGSHPRQDDACSQERGVPALKKEALSESLSDYSGKYLRRSLV